MNLYKHDGPVNYAAFNPDGLTCVTASEDGSIRTWSWIGDKISERAAHGSGVFLAKYSHKYDQVYSVTNTGEIHTWQASKRNMLFDEIPGWSSMAQFIPNTSSIILDEGISQVKEKAVRQTLLGLDSSEKIADFSKNGKYYLIKSLIAFELSTGIS